jgi:hypothetical protein
LAAACLGAVDGKAVVKALKLALPHRAAYIDEFGTSAAYHLPEELENQAS